MVKIILAPILVVFLLFSAVACQSSSSETSQDSSPTPVASQTATETPIPTIEPTETNTPRPTLTPSPRPTLTPTPQSTPAANWQVFGDERLGLRISAPVSWADMTASLRVSEAFGHFGPRLLLLTDSTETGLDLFNGPAREEGVFVFGFIGSPLSTEIQPITALNDILEAAEIEGQLISGPVEIAVNGMSGAMVDLSTDPLGLFPLMQQSWRHRLLVLRGIENGNLAVFLIGSPPEDWDNHRALVEEMLATISLPETKTNINGQLANGEQANGVLREDFSDIWTFNGESGRFATVTVTPEDSQIDLTLTLVDPLGNILASVDTAYAGDLEVMTDLLLPYDGTYIIETTEFFNESGPYQISVLLTDEAQYGGGGRINFSEDIRAELAEDGEHIWLFEGTAGQDVSIVLSSLDDQLDVILEVRGPDDRELALLDEGFAGDTEVLTGLELNVTGDYVILVRGFAGHGGAYSLYLDEGGESTVNFHDAGDLSYGDIKQELLRDDEAHAWFFEGFEGEEVTIEVSPLDPVMDLDIWLLDPELNEVAVKDEFLSGESEKIEQLLPKNGQYLVLVREFFGESGEYEIALNLGGGDDIEIAGTLSYSQTVEGEFPSGKQAGWLFTGIQGDIVNVNVSTRNPERDLVIVLLDPVGVAAVTVDATLSGLPERLVAFRLPADGQWTILIQEFFNEGSDYELTLTKQEP
jgi:hypothetical protein